MPRARVGSAIDGFTVVELLATLVLVGVLAATIMPRIGPRSDTDALALRDQIIAMTRSAQQKAIGHNDVSFSLQPVGAEVQLRIEASASTGSGTEILQTVTMPARQVVVGGDVNLTQSCASQAAPPLSVPLELNFAYPGRLASGGAGIAVPITNGARVCINGNPVMSVCISTAGFAYAGDCDAEF